MGVHYGNYIWILLLISVLAPASHSLYYEDGNLTFIVAPENKPWKEAQSFCRDHGGHMAVVGDTRTQKVLSVLMAVKELSSMWIGARSREDGWNWADTWDVKGNFSAWTKGRPDMSTPYPSCGVLLGSKDFTWFDHPCAMPHAFICERDGACAWTSDSFTLNHQGRTRCFTIHQTTLSWYKARHFCASHGGRLLVLGAGGLFETVKRQLKYELKISGDYWVGYTNSLLQWDIGGPVVETFWEGGQPSREGHCVRIEKFGEESYLWANEDCQVPEAYACQIPAEPLKEPETVEKEDDEQKCHVYRIGELGERGSLVPTLQGFVDNAIYVIIGAGIAFVLLLVPIIVLASKLRSAKYGKEAKNKKKNKQQAENRIEMNQYNENNPGCATINDRLPYPRNIYQSYQSNSSCFGSADNVYNDDGTESTLYTV